MRLAYQGEPGAYSEAAALQYAPHSDTLPCKTFDEVFDAVLHKKATHGVVGIHRDFGDRTNRKHARLKYVVEERGVDWFRAELEKRIGAKLGAARTPARSATTPSALPRTA